MAGDRGSLEEVGLAPLREFPPIFATLSFIYRVGVHCFMVLM